MARDLFNRYIWLVDTIHRAGKITLQEINSKWLRNSMSGGVELPLKTFHNHRKAIEEIFDINIACDRKDGYRYYIENSDDLQSGSIRAWLLNTFAVNNLINESQDLKGRILLEDIPSGQKFLTTVIESMRDGHTLRMTYKSFWKPDGHTVEVGPYFIKIFRQRWYMIAFVPSRNVLRTYALDRILSLEATENTFSMPEDFNPKEYFQNSFGVILDEKCPPEFIELKVYGTKRDYFRTLPLHHSQKEIKTEEDYSIFQYYISPTYDFIQEILSHGYEVEVVSPSHLKGYIRWQAETIASR